MNYIFILFILIILFCIFYFYFVKNRETKILESFSSMDLIKEQINNSSKIINTDAKDATDATDNISNWNGIWVCTDKTRYIYANFKNDNDKLLISASYNSFRDIEDTEDPEDAEEPEYSIDIENEISNNVLLIRCLLNLDTNIFYKVDKIFDNNFINRDIFHIYEKTEKDKIYTYNLSGKLENDIIYIYTEEQTMKFERYDEQFKNYNNAKIENFENPLLNKCNSKEFWCNSLLKDYGWGVHNLYDYRNYIIVQKKMSGHQNIEITYSDFSNKYYLVPFINYRKVGYKENLKYDNNFFFNNILDNNLNIDEVILYYAIGQFPFNFDISKFKWTIDLLEEYANKYNSKIDFLNASNMNSFSTKKNIKNLPVNSFILDTAGTLEEIVNYYKDPYDLPLWKEEDLKKIYKWSYNDIDEYKKLLIESDDDNKFNIINKGPIIKKYANDLAKKNAEKNAAKTITRPPQTTTTPPPTDISTTVSGPPKVCPPGGWTDENPSSGGRHFDCDANGNYLPTNTYCPPNFSNDPTKSICKPNGVFSKSPPDVCPPGGWTDINPGSKNRHFNCDANGNYLSATGGYCPGSYRMDTKFNPLYSTNPVCFAPEPPINCYGIGWIDENENKFECGPEINGEKHYLASSEGKCLKDFINVYGLCYDPSDDITYNKFDYNGTAYDIFINPANMGEYILRTWYNNKFPLPNYKKIIRNMNYNTLDNIIDFYERDEYNGPLTFLVKKYLLFENHPDVNFCDYMNNFYKYNSCIICYVSNLREVKTLNYEFFGSNQTESYLTLQKDKVHSYLNSKDGLLSHYRKILNCNDNTFNEIKQRIEKFSKPQLVNYFIEYVYKQLNQANYTKNILNMLSFTNTIEYKNELSNNYDINDIIDLCALEVLYLHKSQPDNNIDSDETALPMIWNINSNSNVDDYCNFILSTSNLEDKVIKYPQFNPDGTTNLSLFNNGMSKVLNLLNQQLIYESDNKDTYGAPLYSAITGNLCSSNGLYVVEGVDNVGFSNDITSIELKPEPYENGKWLIIGFNLDNKKSLNNIFNNKLF